MYKCTNVSGASVAASMGFKSSPSNPTTLPNAELKKKKSIKISLQQREKERKSERKREREKERRDRVDLLTTFIVLWRCIMFNFILVNFSVILCIQIM